MGSVIDYIECPNCGQEAYSDFYYKTGEEYVNCQHCGYHYNNTIKNRDKKLNELTEDDWETIEIKHPYGAYRIKSSNSIGYACGTLENEEQYIDLKEQVNKNSNIELCTVSRLVDGEIITETIINNEPKNQ
jgi:Zn ribbon nucleic-acid-binding protein